MPIQNIASITGGSGVAACNYRYDTTLNLWVPVSDASPMPTTAAGGSTTGTDRSASVGTSSGQLMPANASRTRFFVKNDSANAIWINLGGTAVAAAGGGNIKVAASGGYFELAGYSGAVNAIAETGAVNITAREL